MGAFTVAIQVGDLNGRHFVEVEAVVDAGASDTMVSGDMLTPLGVEKTERHPYQLADDSVVEYEVGYARIRLNGREGFTLVVFGPEGVAPLLGATTLELFHLGVDPVGKRLIPVPGLLKAIVRSC